ncbi:hypothetical protein [Agrobacterium sp.]|uniref:hypothetical protein n=1 Tax=Agrobacterium sp. TaxID=361 RepID=UPI0025C50EF8|nr:hypothetical protein [Agrobacterium sp.]MCD4661799.1 hypothetical protein [Agrobacterium sp.]
MRNTQALFSATLIVLLGLAGLHQGVGIAWKMAIITAALAFFSEELREWERDFTRSYTLAYYFGNALALLSWLTGAIAGASLLLDA